MLTLLAAVGSLQVDSTVDLEERQSHHGRVHRLAVGDTVRLVDGAGAVAEGIVTSRDGLTVRVGRVDHIVEPPSMTLAVGAGDRDRFGWLVEKATELGVTRISPMVTDRSIDVASRLREGQLDRLRARAVEALKQSGGAWTPAVTAPMTVNEFLTQVEGEERWLCGRGAPTVPRSLVDPGGAITAAIGPEGGWTDDEAALFLEHQFRPVGLSSHVLRFETAALAAAAAAAALRTS